MSPATFSTLSRSAGEWVKRLATVRPVLPKATLGLDIGSSSVKAVGLGPRAGTGWRHVLGSQTVPLADATDAAIQDAIRSAASAIGVPARTPANLAISGQAVIMRVIDMPKLDSHELAQALPFEAQRYLPFNIQEVILDGAIVGSADGEKNHVLIVACRREALERRLALITRAGFEPGLVDVDALAVVNAWLEQAPVEEHARQGPVTPPVAQLGRRPGLDPGNRSAISQGTHAIAHVGSQWTNLVIVKDAQPLLVRDIPWGGQKLMKHMAEQLGRPEDAMSSAVAQASPELAEAMHGASEALAADLQLSFDYFENHFGAQPTRVALSGGLAHSPGFLEALGQHLAQPLAKWEPREGLGSHMAVAYGLALRTDLT